MRSAQIGAALASAALFASCIDRPLPSTPETPTSRLDMSSTTTGPLITPSVRTIINHVALACPDGYGFKVDPPVSGTQMGILYTIYVGANGKTALDWVDNNAEYFVDQVVVKGGTKDNVYDYNPPAANADNGLIAPNNDGGNQADISHVIFCLAKDGEFNELVQLNIRKFYDANTNGSRDMGEPYLSGWKVGLTIGAISDAVYTPFWNQYGKGTTYSAWEYMPIQTNWMRTYPNPNSFSGTLNTETTLEFGNVCVGGGGGKTLGFWSNKNGQAMLNAGALQALRDLHLRNSDGSDYDPYSASGLSSWLLSGTATNMANMLSVQLAAMKLNVYTGGVNGNALIYAPGTTSGNALGFATVNAIMSEANSSLMSYPNTPSGHPQRSYQEALKNALDNANNNKTFVQTSPCTFSFVTM